MSPHGIAVPRGTKVRQMRGKALIGQTPNAATFHRARPKSMREKRYNFLHPGSKFTNLGIGSPGLAVYHWCTARPGLPMCQISSRSDNLSTRYLLVNFVDLVESMTDRNSKRHVTMRRQKANGIQTGQLKYTNRINLDQRTHHCDIDNVTACGKKMPPPAAFANTSADTWNF